MWKYGARWRQTQPHRAPAEVITEFLPEDATPNLIRTTLDQWLRYKRAQVDAGDRSPTYLRELERYCKPVGHFSWWYEKSIFENDYENSQDWSLWLDDRKLGAKTRRNVMGAFHAFCTWLAKRRKGFGVPEFEWPKVPEHQPTIISLETQDLILQAIPEERRGIFLAMALLGLRLGEAIVLEPGVGA